MPSVQTVSIGLRPDQIDDLDELADDEGNDWDSRAAVVREFVDEGLDGAEA